MNLERGSIHPVTEKLSLGNSFWQFAHDNRDLFNTHTVTTHALGEEEKGWKNSQTVDDLAASFVDIGLAVLVNEDKTANGRTVRKYKDQAKRHILGIISISSQEEKDRLIRKFIHFLPAKTHATLNQAKSMDNLQASLVELDGKFREARAPLVAQIQKSKTELSGKVKDYLLSSPTGIFDFLSFLSSEEYAQDREAIRPFLSSFAQNEERLAKDDKENVLSQAAKKWVGEFKERPTPEIMDEFAVSIKSPVILEWFGKLEVDIASFMRSHPTTAAWPSQLESEFSSFISSKYRSVIEETRSKLLTFRTPLTLKTLTETFYPEDEKEVKRVVETKSPSKKTKKPKHAFSLPDLEKWDIREVSEIRPVGVLKDAGGPYNVVWMGDDELDSYLRKKASHLDSSNPRVIEDLKKIVDSLRKDPYGLGTEKLTDKEVGVGNQKFPLRSINTRKRIGISLEHPEARDCRVVYIIAKNKDGPIIGIEGIYKHDEYDKKFV
ncbi:MAG: hypothetical protein Q7R51_02660 [bacterium]|nr:hypothetical protein [bacterium]